MNVENPLSEPAEPLTDGEGQRSQPMGNSPADATSDAKVRKGSVSNWWQNASTELRCQQLLTDPWPTRLTVAALMKQHGYDTACIGKWHLGMNWEGKPGNETAIPVGSRLATSPNAAGFDYFYGYTHARNIGTVIEQDKVEANVAESETQPRLAKKVLAFLEDPVRQAKPFFLYLPLCPPHTPIVPAPEFVGKSALTGKESQYGDWIFQGERRKKGQTFSRGWTGRRDRHLVGVTGRRDRHLVGEAEEGTDI